MAAYNLLPEMRIFLVLFHLCHLISTILALADNRSPEFGIAVAVYKCALHDSYVSSSSHDTSKSNLLPNPEELHLLDIKYLGSISDLTDRLGLCLHRLRVTEVTRCPHLRFLLPNYNLMLSTEKLEVIKGSFCDHLFELFEHTAEEMSPGTALPKQRIIEARCCKALWKLPLRDLNPDTIEEIRGDQLWWTKLEQGSDENTKGRLQHVFKPVIDAKAQLERTLTEKY